MTAEFEPGQRFGAYELGERIGRGGMGVVHEATHVHLGRVVALKLLTPELSESPDFRARFLRESRLAARIEHPAIITVYDAGDVDGVLYLAMRYIRGTDLAAVLAERGPLGVDETVSIVDQVAAALDAAHAAGLVHRDVKPANVMLEDGRCYLGDFGLTKRTDETRALTSAGKFLGTTDYVAPEQIEGRHVDGRTDVYALGCLLFECLTGSRPFQRDSQVAVLYAHLNDPPPQPTAIRPDLPAGFDAVVARAMAKPIEARYPTTAALAVAAQHAAIAPTGAPAPEPPAIPPTAPAPTAYSPPAAPAPAAPPLPPELRTGATAKLPPPSRPRRRIPAVPIALAALLAVVAVVAVVLLSPGGEDTAPSAPRVVGTIPFKGSPVGIVSNAGSVWIADNVNNQVVRLNSDGSRAGTISVGTYPWGMAGNSTSVWVATAKANSVTRIIPPGAHESFPVGKYPLFLTADEDVVYVANAVNSDSPSTVDGSVTRLDARDGHQIGGPIQVGRKPLAIVTGEGSVWVANRDSGNVSRITDGRPAKPIDVDGNPVGLLYRDHVIWVASTGVNTVTRIDARNGNRLASPTKVGGAPYALADFAGFVWVTNRDDHTIWRLDTDTGERVGEPIPVLGDPAGMTVHGGELWVTAKDTVKQGQNSRVYRIAP